VNTSTLPVKILGREPAAWLAFVAIVVKLVSAFIVTVGDDTQAYINAAAAAGMGLLIAVIVHDGVIAAVLGLVQASISLAVGLGLDWSADRQALVMTAVTILFTGYDRSVVTAPVPAGAVGKRLTSVA
jgi:low affinity Fe/Cu permease